MSDHMEEARRIWVLNYCLRASASAMLSDMESGALPKELARTMGPTEWIQVEAVLAELGPETAGRLDIDSDVESWHHAMPDEALARWAVHDAMAHSRREAISIWWSLDALMDPRLQDLWAKTEARRWLDLACEYIQWAEALEQSTRWAKLWLTLAPSLSADSMANSVLRNPVLTVDLLPDDDND